MKRITALIFIFTFIFTACTKAPDTEISETAPQIICEDDETPFIASWLSFMELSVVTGRETEEKYINYIDNIFDNMKDVGVTDVFVHVRPFSDAFYFSDIFPSSSYATGKQGEKLPFDVLSVVIKRAKEKNINIHAWINPYRVSSKNDISALSEKNPAYRWYEEGREDCVAVAENGIYFNPASEDVRKLIVDGVREILEKYDVKGIHTDDYFYFPSCGDFDKEDYERYKKNGGDLDLYSWRRENVNTLISSLYIAVKSYGEEKIFSVSPSGNISKCYNEDYADVKLWCENEGYCDMIIPQIYFGFDNESLPFGECLSQWVSFCEGGSTKLVAGLALYKAGTEDPFALSGENEWKENSNIISRQVKLLKEKNCYGFALYSGTYINFSEKILSEELNNLKSVL